MPEFEPKPGGAAAADDDKTEELEVPMPPDTGEISESDLEEIPRDSIEELDLEAEPSTEEKERLRDVIIAYFLDPGIENQDKLAAHLNAMRVDILPVLAAESSFLDYLAGRLVKEWPADGLEDKEKEVAAAIDRVQNFKAEGEVRLSEGQMRMLIDFLEDLEEKIQKELEAAKKSAAQTDEDLKDDWFRS